MFLATLAAVSLLLTEVAPPASEAAVKAAAAPQDKKAAKEGEIVCRKEVVLGSMFPKKVCWRKDEMSEQQRQQRLELYRSQGTSLKTQ